MPRMQVYLPDELYGRVKALGADINVSGLLQTAITEHLARLERREALAAALEARAAESGAFTPEELDRQVEADRAAMVYPRARKRRSSAA